MADLEHAQDPRATVESFTMHNWRTLAGAAWRAYLRLGRGALLVASDVIAAWESGQGFHFSPAYVTRMEVEEFSNLIATYDPDTSIIIAVTSDSEATRESGFVATVASDSDSPETRAVRAGQSFGAWIFTAEPPPPEAHKRTGN